MDSQVMSPRELIIPIISGSYSAQPKVSGAIFISGNFMFVRVTNGLYKVSGAVIAV